MTEIKKYFQIPCRAGLEVSADVGLQTCESRPFCRPCGGCRSIDLLQHVASLQVQRTQMRSVLDVMCWDRNYGFGKVPPDSVGGPAGLIADPCDVSALPGQLEYPEGPSTPYLKSLVPNTIEGYGLRGQKLHSSGTWTFCSSSKRLHCSRLLVPQFTASIAFHESFHIPKLHTRYSVEDTKRKIQRQFLRTGMRLEMVEPVLEV